MTEDYFQDRLKHLVTLQAKHALKNTPQKEPATDEEQLKLIQAKYGEDPTAALLAMKRELDFWTENEMTIVLNSSIALAYSSYLYSNGQLTP